jgi:hypothetical protein
LTYFAYPIRYPISSRWNSVDRRDDAYLIVWRPGTERRLKKTE